VPIQETKKKKKKKSLQLPIPKFHQKQEEKMVTEKPPSQRKKISLKTAGGKKTCKDDDVLRETNCKLFTTCECRPFLLTPATLILAVAAATAAADSKRQYSLVASSHPALTPHVVRCNDETKNEVEDEEEEEEEEAEEANDDKSRAGIATTSAYTTHKLRKCLPQEAPAAMALASLFLKGYWSC